MNILSNKKCHSKECSGFLTPSCGQIHHSAISAVTELDVKMMTFMIWVKIMEWGHNHFDQGDFQIDALILTTKPGAILRLAKSVINLKILADWDAEYGSALYKSFVQTRLKPLNNESRTWSKIFGMRWKNSARRPLSGQYRHNPVDHRRWFIGHFRPYEVRTIGLYLFIK